jgi:ABC-type spermidine/putrescine transport system permease subunit I
MKIIMTLVLFIALPYILRVLLKKGIIRRKFAIVTSLSYATLFFLLSIMYVNHDSVVIGVIMFVCIIIGGYPTAYLLFPILHKTVV